jgi:beta-aspartyl-peptidase (threonine type)
MRAIVVHGGAGRWPESERTGAIRGVAEGAAAGWAVLENGGSALDAVSAAVVRLEDDPLFNAGTGSVLNAEGEVEMDASIMAGDDLRCGGVACLRRVRNPVLVARRVMETTDWVLLAGEGALRFARAQGFADYDPVTERRRAQWKTAAASGSPGTVGAIAIDGEGRLAAATSTGGRELKAPGRVGDSPVPGSGNYASTIAAISATGVGEMMLRAATAKAIEERIRAGLSAQAAAAAVLDEMRARFGEPIGVICIDARGGIGIVHGTPAMPHALRSDGMAAVQASFSLR